MTSYARSLRWSAWLGWRIDSNWTAPWLFVLYVLVKPLAGALLPVCMVWAAQAATGSTTATDFLPFLYVSSACFLVIGGVAAGMSGAVVADRENYGMLKFIRISPAPLRGYLVGRGLSRAAQAGAGSVLTVGVGLLLFPGLRDAVAGAAWGWLLVFLPLGVVMLVGLGLLLAGAVLNMARYGGFLSEGVAGVLFLFSGAVFPIDLLPAGVQPVSLALPPTYWLEGMRRALIGPAKPGLVLSGWPTTSLALALAASTTVLWVVAHLFFRWSERRAWRLGRYDETSGN